MAGSVAGLLEGLPLALGKDGIATLFPIWIGVAEEVGTAILSDNGFGGGTWDATFGRLVIIVSV